MTRVNVKREGKFTRSGVEEVDEAEIFEGGENALEMTQTYTRQFQCKYRLRQYPFDNQVKSLPIISSNCCCRNVLSKCLRGVRPMKP